MNAPMPKTWPYRGLLIRSLLAALVLTTVFHALQPQVASADIPVAHDDFEDHEDGPTGYGWFDDWYFDDDSNYWDDDEPHSDSSHLRLRGSSSSASRSVDVSGESASLRLRFWARCEDLDDNEGVIEVSSDGVNYTEISRWTEDFSYALFDLDLSGFSFDDRVWFRARVEGDDDDDGEIYLDDVEIVNSSDDPDESPETPDAIIELDGQFGDWTGKPMLADSSGDQEGSSRRDIAALYWANNPDEQVNYHLIQRHTTDGQPYNGNNGQDGGVNFILYVDGNNNGDYDNGSDRRIVVSYYPVNNESYVRVRAYEADSFFDKVYDSGWEDWGESRNEGGLRVEFAIDWDDLSIEFGEVIRMYAISYFGFSVFPDERDRVPDGSADIQWSPASVLGPWLLAGAGTLGIIVIWYLSRRRRLWT